MSQSQKIQRHWYALYTRPRFEKIVDYILKDKGLNSFLPLHPVTTKSRKSKRTVYKPLFPSYVFVHANANEQDLAVQSYGVARFVCFNGRPQPIPEEQIGRVSRILEQGYNPEPFDYLVKGDRVQIISGPFKGLDGYYVKEKGKHRLVLSIDIIQQAIAVSVNRNEIRKITSDERLNARV